MTGSLAPPPPYGSEQGSILLEAGRDGAQITHQTFAHARSRSGNIRIGPPQSPGPVRSPTEISLAQLAHIPSHEDVGEGTSRSVGGGPESPVHPSELASQPTAPQDYGELPPEYTSPEGSMRRNSDDTNDERRPLIHDREGSPEVPSYDVAVGNEPERGRDSNYTRYRD